MQMSDISGRAFVTPVEQQGTHVVVDVSNIPLWLIPAFVEHVLGPHRSDTGNDRAIDRIQISASRVA